MKELYKISELPLTGLLGSDFLIITSLIRSSKSRSKDLISQLFTTIDSNSIQWTVDTTSLPVKVKANIFESFLGETSSVRFLLQEEGIAAYNYNFPTINTDTVRIDKNFFNETIGYSLAFSLQTPVLPNAGGLGLSITPQNNTLLIGTGSSAYNLYNISTGLKVGVNDIIEGSLTQVSNSSTIGTDTVLRVYFVDSPSIVSNPDAPEFNSTTIRMSDILQNFNIQYIQAIYLSCAGGLGGARSGINISVSPNFNQTIETTGEEGACIIINNLSNITNSTGTGSITTTSKNRSRGVAGLGSVANEQIRSSGIEPYDPTTTADIARNETLLSASSINVSNLNTLIINLVAYRTITNVELSNGNFAKAVAYIDLKVQSGISLSTLIKNTNIKFTRKNTIKRVYKSTIENNIFSSAPVSFGNFLTGIYTIKYKTGAFSRWSGLDRWEWASMGVYGKWGVDDYNFFSPVIPGGTPDGWFYSNGNDAILGGQNSAPYSFYHYNFDPIATSIYTSFPDDPHTDNRKWGGVAPTFDLYEEVSVELLQTFSVQTQTNALIVSIDPLGGIDLNANNELKIKDRLTYIDSNTEINLFIDGSGSMDPTRAWINNAFNNYFKEIIKVFYNNDINLTTQMSQLLTMPVGSVEGESWIKFVNYVGRRPATTKVVNVYIGDETDSHYYSGSTYLLPTTPLLPNYTTDLSNLRTTWNSRGNDYFRIIVLQLQYDYETTASSVGRNFGNQLHYMKYGLGNYSGNNGLSDKPGFDFVPDIPRNMPPCYYANILKDVLVKL